MDVGNRVCWHCPQVGLTEACEDVVGPWMWATECAGFVLRWDLLRHKRMLLWVHGCGQQSVLAFPRVGLTEA
eukprot:607241-Pelagomonas_calceolata.AAC.4